MMRGPGSGWCKMKSPADTVCVAGHIPESPSSSSARQRLRPSARVPPFPPHPGPLPRGARPAGAHGVSRAAVGPRLRPRLRPAPARGAAGVARGGRPSLPGSFAGEVGPAAPSSVEARGPGARPAVASPCTVAADIRAQSAPSRAAWPLGTAPERLGARRGVRAEAWGWGPVFAPAKRIPSVPPRGPRLPEAARSCEKPPPAPRGASASCCCGSCCRDLPRAAGPRAQHPPPRPPRPWPRGQRPPRRASVPAARPLAPRAPGGPGRQAPGPGMSAQQRDRRPRAAAPVRRVPPLRRSPGGGCRDPRWPRRRPAPVSRFICVKLCLFDSL